MIASDQAPLAVYETASACAGAVASYVLRRIAYRAGAHAPGIQEAIFHELHAARDGRTIVEVARWFGCRAGALAELGYRLELRRVSMPTQALVAWVRAGAGYRGAVLMTSARLLHADAESETSHAIGLSLERPEPDADGELVMTDPSVRVGGRCSITPALEPAHRDRDYLALGLHWVGWS